jgi:hypothetical protein
MDSRDGFMINVDPDGLISFIYPKISYKVYILKMKEAIKKGAWFCNQTPLVF